MKNLLFIIFLFVFSFGNAQNLVPNHSFEEKNKCPISMWNIQDVVDWNKAGLGDPAYFHSCDTSSVVGVPKNLLGNQFAYNGNAYIKISTYFDGTWACCEARDYAQVKLKESLKAGIKYYWCMWVSLCDTSEYATNNIGISLSDTLVNQLTYQNLNIPVYGNSEKVIYEKNDWVEISGDFISNGGENYLIIGNLYTHVNTSKIKLKNPNGGDASYGSYYYIDNVYLGEKNKCSDAEPEIPNVFTPNGDGLNDLFSLDFPYKSVKIYNRWSQLVFETKDNGIYWDGRTNAAAIMPEGTYYYVVKTENETYKGYLQLLR